MATTGVFPVNQIKFKVGTKGLQSASPTDFVIVKDMETFGMSFDDGVEEWNPLDQGGWVNRLVTAKSLTISLEGKRNYGDPGNDYVASLAYENGQASSTKIEVEFPDGGKLTMEAVINVTENGGGDSTAVGALSFELMSNGKPMYTAAV